MVSTAFSLASKLLVSVLIAIFPSLTCLTLLHHGFVLVIAHRNEDRRKTPVVSKALIQKTPVCAVGDRRKVLRGRLEGKFDDVEANSNGDEEDSKPEDEPVQQSDQEGSGTMKNAGFDGSPLVPESAKPADDKKVVEDDGVLNNGCSFLQELSIAQLILQVVHGHRVRKPLFPPRMRSSGE
ncbi:hypothetical protein BD410DRAFT_804811 [Rickenella mellea]|uniref:Uncharacterized protein n=1 Tax=Rickenella mellea TaxID=50990 RepID=A0A4Y7Q017_9AGAM|nr:hypothetical protein BD410DRAFT_804811 [Rickenella mellea]